MYTTIEKLREYFDKTVNPIITYQDWLKCLKSFIEKIQSDNLSFTNLYNASLLK